MTKPTINRSEDAYEVALKRIKNAFAMSAMVLDLSDLGLETLPSEIGQLTALVKLELQGNQLSSLPPEIGQLTALTWLDLANNQLSSLLPEIGQLTALTDLYLYDNQLSSLPPEMGRLTELTNLDLSINQLSSLPPEIGQLTALVVLDLSGNQLLSLPPEIGQLTALTELRLSGNRLPSLPQEIGQLTALKALDLSNNQLSSLPPEIGQLTALVVLDLSGNQLLSLPPEIGQLTALWRLDLNDNTLPSLPSEIGQLTALTSLDLNYNRLRSLPPEIGQLTALAKLELPNNQLSSLPPEIGQLTALLRLNLYDNRLSSLPASMSRLTALREMFLHENPALDLPTEVLGPKPRDVYVKTLEGQVVYEVRAAHPMQILTYYLAQQREGTQPLNEAKILVVGEPEVGKTALIGWLVEGKKIDNPEWTKGIKISEWSVKANDAEEPIRVNVWDFGGQEIMQATHQFFLTERSLYILVLDSRQNEEQSRLRHWLERIRAFGANSPVIVVLNKRDQGSLEPDESRLQKDYPANLGDRFFRTSCETGEGIEELLATVQARVRELDNVHQPVPKRYMAAKRELEEKAAARKYLDDKEYARVCDGHKLDPTDQRTLLSYLRQLGTLMHYQDPLNREAVDKTYVLDPDWVTRGVYGILTHPSIRDDGGIFDGKQLRRFFTGEEYPSDRQRFILGMMLIQPFELCLELPNKPGHFLVPELLLANEPPHGIRPETSLNFQYEYMYLPAGLMPRFIVRMQHHLTPSAYWKHGSILSFDGDARMQVVGKQRPIRALVRASLEERKVFVSVEGETPGNQRALTIIRDTLASIHGSMRHLQVEEQVPLPDDPKITVPYEYLCQLEREEGPDFLYKPPKAVRKYSVKELLDGVEIEKDRHKRAADRDEFAKGTGRVTIQHFHERVEHAGDHDQSRRFKARDLTGSNVNFGETPGSHVTISTGTGPMHARDTHGKPAWWKSLIAPTAVTVAAVILAALIRWDPRSRVTMLFGVAVVAFGVTYCVQQYLAYRRAHWDRMLAGFFAGMVALSTLGPTVAAVLKMEKGWLVVSREASSVAAIVFAILTLAMAGLSVYRERAAHEH